MKIQEFTMSEIRHLIDECNFSSDEQAYFELKSKGESNVAIAFKLNVSCATVTRIAHKVKTKIEKVLGASL